MSPKSERPSAARQRVAPARVRPANADSCTLQSKRATSAHVTRSEVQTAPNFSGDGRPTMVMRAKLAAAFDQVMSEMAFDGLDQFSNRAIARRLRITEKTVRLWRLGEKTLPAHVLALFPVAIRRRMLAHVERLATT